MTTYEFSLDRDNFEIFPKEIWSDLHIVFHGTSEFHSDYIEQNGLIINYCPFNKADAIELISLLKKKEVAIFDTPRGINSNTAKALEHYINNTHRLSFSYLSFLATYYSYGIKKGGQIVGLIRDAQNIISKAISQDPDVHQYMTPSINRIFKRTEDIAKTNGVVYAIKLTEPYLGIQLENRTFHSTNPIDVSSIIGKVILPVNFLSTTSDDSIALVKDKDKFKKIGNLGAVLYRMEYE